MAVSHKNGLGKGLSALLGNEFTQKEESGPDNGLKELAISTIEPNSNQPRKIFDEEAMADLEQSIRTHGVITPITVRKTDDDRYQIVAGERRWRAARKAGLRIIPAMIIDADDKTVMELALIENLQRLDLNPIEEAEGYHTLMSNFNLTQEQAAERVGKSRSAVANCLRLLGLDPNVRTLVAEGKLSSGHARAVLSLDDKTRQEELAVEIIEKELSVRQAEALAKRINKGQQSIEPETEIKINYMVEIEKDIEAVLGRKVKISNGKNKGTIELEFYNDEDLERLALALKNVNI